MGIGFYLSGDDVVLLLNFFLWIWYGPEQYERMKATEKKMQTGLRYNAGANYEVDRIFKKEGLTSKTNPE